MIANMTPVLQPGVFVFCAMLNRDDTGHAMSKAKAMFIEDEGLSLILPKSDADALGLTYDQKMRQITLMVFSSVSGVGLTAAVAKALAKERISANIVAATHHDHIFVPSKHADTAIRTLRALQEQARAEER
ncbi:MAG: ACT domain-containing protein [Silicimonas sp.]|nr:ACT domain-containing protein [Silicimonas sp.]